MTKRNGSTWHYVGMEIAGLYIWRWRHLVAPHHPDDVEDPFSAIFRTLLPNVNCRLGLVIVVPLIGLEIWVRWGCEGWTSVLGLGSGEEVDGTPAGLLALSLAESLSERFVLFTPSCGWVIFIFLQLGRTRYFRGSGPFYEICEKRHLFIERWILNN